MSRNEKKRPGIPPDGEDGWALDEDTLADLGLEAVLGNSEFARDETKDPGQVGIRTAPSGFRAILRDIARGYSKSFSELARRSSTHGAAILAADLEMRKLTEAHAEAWERAMNRGEQRALNKLDQVHPYDFRYSETCRTTLAIDLSVRGQLAEIADICGLPLGRVAVIAILASLLTLPNERGYRRILLEEMDGFWAEVRERRQFLKLG